MDNIIYIEERTKMKKAFVKDPEDKLVPVLEIWESIGGWYWYVTEKDIDGDSDISYGLVDGVEKEWGNFSIEELKSLGNKVWRIDKKHWSYTGRGDIIMA